MYTIYCDGDILFHPEVDELAIVDPKLSLEVNRAGAFDFKIYPQHPAYGKINKLKNVIEVFQDGVLLFRGRPLDFDLDFYNGKIVRCEGDMAYLNDTIIRPYEYEGGVRGYLEKLITEHNEQVEDNKKFVVGDVSVADANDYIVRADSAYPSTWSIIEEKLINKLGGYLVVRRSGDVNYLDYLIDSEYKSNQVIEFAENLLDVSQFIKGAGIKTAIIPLGAKLTDEEGQETGERLTIKVINDGKDFVFNQTAVDMYGWIYEVVEFDDVNVAENLKRKGEEHLAKTILSEFSIELTAVDLSLLDVNIDEFRVFEYIKVVSAPHQLDSLFLVKKLSLDLVNPANNKVSVGADLKTFTDKDFSDKNTIKDTVSDVVLGQANENIKNEVLFLTSLIQQTAESITTSVSEKYVSNDNFTEYKSEVSTQFEQTAESFNFQFTNIQESITNLEGDVQNQFNEIVKYIRFEDGNIILGQVGNELILRIAHDRISFLQGAQEVAYMSNNKLYITDAEILTNLRVGNYSFVPRANGNLSFRYVGAK